jgi:hypothetical protein
VTDFVAIPQCNRCGGVHTVESEACLRGAVKLTADTDFAAIGFPSDEPEGWRRIAPADCIGTPIVGMQYAAELQRLAQQQGLEVRSGDTLTARYRRIDDEWHPIPETLEVTR